MKLTGTGVMALAALAAVGYVSFLVIAKKKDIKEAAAEVLDKINPASENNVVYTSVNSAGAQITGDENFTLGGWIYDKTHADVWTEKPPQAATGPTAAQLDKIYAALRDDGSGFISNAGGAAVGRTMRP